MLFSRYLVPMMFLCCNENLWFEHFTTINGYDDDGNDEEDRLKCYSIFNEKRIASRLYIACY